MSNQTRNSPELSPISEETLPAEDPRWLAVQRILASSGFQRAGQLRKILLYITTSVILRPDQPLREYEIACNVLGRRSDFDPLDDNIVRAQMSHLRRKLDAYYREEGQTDSLRLSIPKGSYFPHFQDFHPPLTPAVTPSPAPPPSPLAPSKVIRGLVAVLAITSIALLITTTLLLRRLNHQTEANPVTVPSGNAYVQFLAHFTGPVKIVLPDLSLVAVQQQFDIDLRLEQYHKPDYMQSSIDTIKEPDFHYALTQIRNRRNTSFDEVVVGMDVQKIFDLHGIPNSVRFAHDVTIRDVSEGNSVLIGSYRSNPITALFNDRLNYRFEEDYKTHNVYFSNQHPAPGEPTRYAAYKIDRVLNSNPGMLDSYIDIALVPNLTHSGFILLFDGSDNEAVLAASRFLMDGKLPPAIDNALKKEDLSYFEFFFRGYHVDFQDEEKFELLSVRSEPGK